MVSAYRDIHQLEHPLETPHCRVAVVLGKAHNGIPRRLPRACLNWATPQSHLTVTGPCPLEWTLCSPRSSTVTACGYLRD
jgi:hypothetical protein